MTKAKEMNKNFKDLEDKILSSKIFIVIGTSNYMKDLRKRNSAPYIQSNIAKKYKKPVLIIFIKGKIKEEEKIELERFYSSYNVVKEVDIDLFSDEGNPELIKVVKDIIDKGNNKSVLSKNMQIDKKKEKEN